VDSIGASVTKFKVGDRVIISCITSCSSCELCRKGISSHCADGGWILGHTIDGTQAEYVRTPHADGSLHHLVNGASEEEQAMCSDVLPTAFECGVLVRLHTSLHKLSDEFIRAAELNLEALWPSSVGVR
jgi:alcohol dehydrogenase